MVSRPVLAWLHAGTSPDLPFTATLWAIWLRCKPLHMATSSVSSSPRA